VVRRNSKRVSVLDNGQGRLSGVPSTIQEGGSPTLEYTTYESMGEPTPLALDAGGGGDDKGVSRFSRFSFYSNMGMDMTAEEIEKARHNFRKSMSGNLRKSIFVERTEKAEGGMDMSDIPESIMEENMMDEDDEEYESTNILEELKHEIMVNYLFQQQCAKLWIADGTGDVEGVMLRKSRGNYLACPPALADSVFADSCVEINVQVSCNK